VLAEGNRLAVGYLDDLDRRCPGECLILRVLLGELAGEGLLVVAQSKKLRYPWSSFWHGGPASSMM
jgi:hypothetical protein